MKTYEFTVPVLGDALVRIEAHNLADAYQQLLKDPPPFDDVVYYKVDWKDAELVENVND